MLIIAHRGNMEDQPEDTAEAIWDAARLGADGIEFDAHQSADGTWWVIHDPTVDRTTNGAGWVWQMTDVELRSLTIDAGPGFRAGQRIGLSRLDDLLAGLGAYPGWLYVDLQHAVVANPSSLALLLDSSDAFVICRNESDVSALAASTVRSIIRPSKAAPDSASDAFLPESVGEASLETLANASAHQPGL
ncbi:MAG: glycerophosphodiester phosphodiesterase family protein [Candidatus Limnocylindria bacterium]